MSAFVAEFLVSSAICYRTRAPLSISAWGGGGRESRLAVSECSPEQVANERVVLRPLPRRVSAPNAPANTQAGGAFTCHFMYCLASSVISAFCGVLGARGLPSFA